MRIRTRVGTGLLVAAALALVLPLAACSGDDTPPYPVIEVTPLPSARSARSVISTGSQQDFHSGLFVMYAFDLTVGGVLDITVDWTHSSSWIYVYFGANRCGYDELEQHTCPFLISSETQQPKPRLLYTDKLSAGRYYLVFHNVAWDARTRIGSDNTETVVFQLGLTVTGESGERLPVRLSQPIVVPQPGR